MDGGLPADFRVGSDPAALGDLQAETRTFVAAGMDGYFTDDPDVASELGCTAGPVGSR